MISQSLPIYLPTPYFNSGNRHMFHADVRTRQSTNKDKACEGIDTSTTVSSEPRIMSYNPSFDSYNASQACCDVPPRQQSLRISQSLVWLCCGPFRSNNCVAVHGWLLMWSEEPLCIKHAEVRMAAAASTLICVLATIHSSQSASCRLMQAHAYGRSPSWFFDAMART